MDSSQEIYNLLKKAGFEFPNDCVDIMIHLVAGKEAEACIVHHMKIGGKYVIDEGETVKKSRRVRFYDPDKPVICSCCGRYVRHSPE